MSIRAKFVCTAIDPSWENAVDDKKVRFEARYDDTIEEDRRFNKYTPTGHFEMICNNPGVIAQLEVGKAYYFDVSPVDEPATEPGTDDCGAE